MASRFAGFETKSTLKISAEAHRVRRAIHERVGAQPDAIEAARLAALNDRAKAEAEAATQAEPETVPPSA